VLSDAEFRRICELVREHSGIALSDAKRQMVYGRLVRRLRALRLSSFAEYVRLLERGEPLELEEFTNAITTNLTSFFRESITSSTWRPAAAAIAPAVRASGRLRIWSSACSTGKSPTALPWSCVRSRIFSAYRRQDPGDRPRLESARHGGRRCVSGGAAAADGAIAREGILPRRHGSRTARQGVGRAQAADHLQAAQSHARLADARPFDVIFCAMS